MIMRIWFQFKPAVFQEGDQGVDDELMQKLLFEDVDIPSMPDAVIRILAILEEKNASLNKIEETILQDQSLTANILRIANTPFYQTGKQITILADAIMSLGIHNLSALVSILSFKQQLMSKNVDRNLLRHPYVVSVISSMLAGEVEGVRKEEALVAGLLHDIGVMVIYSHSPATYETLNLKIQVEHTAFVEAENEIFGKNHCHIGSILARKWHIPQIYDYVIGHHHDVEVSGGALTQEERLCYLVRVADHMTFEAGIGIGTSFEANLPKLMTVLGIDKVLYDDAVKRIPEAADIL